jgi:hypothetical protein
VTRRRLVLHPRVEEDLAVVDIRGDPAWIEATIAERVDA